MLCYLNVQNVKELITLPAGLGCPARLACLADLGCLEVLADLACLALPE